ncbi:MBL fold metallo-hydrolase [Candidatus Berkelbacteria bacterium CG_4_8_14_3_um_filter_33_6]|uniref:MBL fold metallo-hydrolase n=1 Tax=Candidatus Berkelbacteria bacterium CG_4_10_14_0_2_um_filter_35_9_33_12 TaxID=1974499 RepID=A0A2M7W4L1_9BACT|nr:MAG: MBL fold metallo-hydrolase [Candidatus Berkelbacteria bacterium CG23_combo_of_CG06-09_8_20_14_all_33_15]PIS08383.1 MAG: MBL fold metallo-hydrolase [Candidatus Berkelbacteria bacterium CG10_big_fil_rev_8_21_14_0_10_33_10]PIX31244.1 MAG: MBL fold metallo-hydrolase [Candidatus Berkelbacteria bacterium CG_4_8_14_3_um_filter_33_6]PIZ28406.1 MAG: MBL fold metallo-hydrolase [Candidatus Berkelbacteria bacterium CG_4_10_14_0_8_um_filter_35_9_33_8]PJA20541.1 MAG: MBL fold metallo-hydrolase [Candi
MSKKSLFSKNILIALLLASLSLWYVLIFDKDNLLRVYTLNVGQGDAILISKNHFQLLVDTGRGDMTYSRVKQYLPFNDNKIELLILSHLDGDHIGGGKNIVDKIVVDEIWTLNWQKDTEMVKELKNKVEEKKILTKFIRAGEEKIIQTHEGEIKIKTINPAEYILESEGNNNSIVVKVSYNELDFLLTGDLENEGEKKLLEKNIDLQSEILKVGHHGSRSSTSQEFIDRVKPEVSLISVGKNSYGHPSQDILNRLKSINSKIYRTDKSGTIEISTDGKIYSVKTEK